MRALSILALLLGLAAWINWTVWTRPTDLTSLPAGRSGNLLAALPETPIEAARFDSTLLQTYARPLFEPSRRPYEPPAVEAAAPAGIPEQAPAMAVAPVITQFPEIRVLGIQRMPGQAQALLQLQGESQAVWYRQEDSVGGWILKDIGSVHLTFTRDGQEASADLYPDTGLGGGIN
ncbi:hypothetical protein DFR52_102169 [Hoeflea marina]|uniref:Uncharacterized protein n=1 Tax=Hoeflea marina TaxID=274592 RepID=A0A317PL77_9HYPH|nr:hypothetical protein [Hoeflea marina]PWW01507.1 hypothetical protein DFR52_102169 [Hoeflea marina]